MAADRDGCRGLAAVGHRRMARRAVAGSPRHPPGRRGRRLLPARRRLAGRRTARLAHPRARARVHDGRCLRPSAAAADGRRGRVRGVRARRPAQHVQRRASDPAHHAVGADRGRRAAVHLRGAPLDGLAADRELDPAAVPRLRLPPRGAAVADRGRACRCSSRRSGRMATSAAVRSAAARGPASPATTRAAEACTCGCGSPSRSRTRSTRSGLAGAPWVSYYARALGAKLGAERRSALASAGDRNARDRRRRRDRAGSRPVGLLDRRRHRADRRHQHRRGRDDRHSQHARTGHADRAQRRDRPRIRRLRAGARRPAVGGLARGPRRRNLEPARTRAPAGAEAVAVGVRRVIRDARSAARSSRSLRAAWCSPRACAAPPRSSTPFPAALRLARPRRPSSSGCRSPAAVVLLVRLLSIGLVEGVHPSAAEWRGRRGRPSDCWTRRGPSCSRCTPACSRPSGSGCWAPRSGATSKHPPSCSSRH